ncbi:hypothetical protein AOQ84DRAFT_374486 [Glonium stellatum]|uniref:Uncharacterized protein n=1 Tax=Glonium stellatum TaxID=574774 RepID=A0A8E2JVN1_9PEZI|nr:hypothetical protein AOQ84DRAFT_374486 [Glonium stellatum]
MRVDSLCPRCDEIFEIRMKPAMQPLFKRIRLLINLFKRVNGFAGHIQSVFDKAATESGEQWWEGSLVNEYDKEKMKKLERHLNLWWTQLKGVVEADFKRSWEHDEQAVILFELKKDARLEDDYVEPVVEDGQVMEEDFDGPWAVDAFYQRSGAPVDDFMKDLEMLALGAGLIGVEEFVIEDMAERLSECSKRAGTNTD